MISGIKSAKICASEKKIGLLHKIFAKNLCEYKNMFYFCTRNQQLGYGVMVTLQILVLSFLVRIQVAQLKREQHHVVLFFLLGFALGGGKSSRADY